ncbi:MAG TPA: hypothetical protein VF618_27785 [Thermoanaerobaculia bacterium]
MLRVVIGLTLLLLTPVLFGATQGAPLGVPQPLFPPNNWWNTDISAAPVDSNSAAYIQFIGTTRALHPDFGGDAGDGTVYGFPIIVVDSRQPKKTVEFFWPDQSDGVDHSTEESVPFYPVPDEAITQSAWIEGGQPGNVDLRDDHDRHILIVDKNNNRLYELYNVWFDGTRWQAGSGAHFYMNRNDRRPDTWTSADAAGLAILPGLVRYEEVYGPGEIRHALRVTVRATNGYVYPASHRAGSTAGALPMGARLRLKASVDLSTFPAEMQKLFRAFKRYGLIVADNGSDMYISGSYDTRWNNDILNPQFRRLKASDFEVVQLGWAPQVTLVATIPPTVGNNQPAFITVTAKNVNDNVVTSYRGTIQFTSSDPAATLPPPYTFTAADNGVHTFPAALTLRTNGAQVLTVTDAANAQITGSRGTTVVPVLHTAPQAAYWACFHYTSRTDADAHMNRLNLDATLVATGYPDYPYVVIERWDCGSCAQSPEPLFLAERHVTGIPPGTNERTAIGNDGTPLLVRRREGASSAPLRNPATAYSTVE